MKLPSVPFAVLAVLALAAFRAWAAAPPAPADFHLNGDAERGKAVYVRTCALCHGVNGDAKSKMAETMKPKPIDFTDKALVDKRSDWELYLVVRDGGRRSACRARCSPGRPPSPTRRSATPRPTCGRWASRGRSQRRERRLPPLNKSPPGVSTAPRGSHSCGAEEAQCWAAWRRSWRASCRCGGGGSR